MERLIKKYLYSCFLTIICTGTTQSLCVIDAVTVYSDGQKTICLIGEAHNHSFKPSDCYAAAETRDTKYLIDLAQSTTNSSQPVIFCMEASDLRTAMIAKYFQTYPDLLISGLPELALYAHEHNKKIGNTHFIFADNRGPALTLLADYMFIWHRSIFSRTIREFEVFESLPEELTPQIVDQELSNNPLLRQSLFAPNSLFSLTFNDKEYQKMYGHAYTIDELYAELNCIISTLVERLATIDKNSALYKFLNPYKELLVKAISNAIDFFVKEVGDVEKCVADYTHDAIVNKSFSYVSDQYEKWGQYLHRVADISFAQAIDEALSHSDKVIFFGGQGHCNRLQPFLKLKNFRKIYDAQNGSIASNGFSLSHWKDEIIKMHFENVKQALGFLTPSPCDSAATTLSAPEQPNE